ncbi:hypothetical protein H5410_018479 [Solanum commersonii]|uniref:Uncharacterized protein n=1 Tax=Solanum commersonii TaxID=4109 RepID=A0A9J6A3I0_SOLCO|nr:hypothetical protein H5410_018479 [Solanum commersonii]
MDSRQSGLSYAELVQLDTSQRKLQTGTTLKMANEMGSLDNRVAEATEKLESIQKRITQHVGTSVANTLFDIEKEDVVELQKWSDLQENVLKQKSKAHWLEVGDNNNRHFFACMKTRANLNNISILTSLDGRQLLKHDEIEKEILQIYKSLMGSRNNCLPSIDIKRLTVAQCRPLVEKITAKITSWMARRVLYARRIQQIRAVLMGVQAYWSQLFLLRQKTIKLVEATCRSYLWSGEAQIIKRALVAWDKICLPKGAGGLNIINISEAYRRIRGDVANVEWRSLVCHSVACPKQVFTLWVALH